MTIKHLLTTKVPEITIDEAVYTIGLYHFNWHKEIEIFWLLNGKVEMNVDGKTIYLLADDLYVINSNVGHATFATSPDTIAMRLHVNPFFFSQQRVDTAKGRFIINTAANGYEKKFEDLKCLLARLHKQLKENPENVFKINALYYGITSILLDNYVQYEQERKSNAISDENNQVVKNVVQYIEDNYYRDISLDYLAERSNYTSAYLSKKIKDEIGINFHDFLTRCRLRLAVLKLTQEGKIGDIALNSGFKDVRAFNLMFKRHFGITPSQYREKLGENIQGKIDAFNKELNARQVIIYQKRMKEMLEKL